MYCADAEKIKLRIYLRREGIPLVAEQELDPLHRLAQGVIGPLKRVLVAHPHPGFCRWPMGAERLAKRGLTEARNSAIPANSNGSSFRPLTSIIPVTSSPRKLSENRRIPTVNRTQIEASVWPIDFAPGRRRDRVQPARDPVRHLQIAAHIIPVDEGGVADDRNGEPLRPHAGNPGAEVDIQRGLAAWDEGEKVDDLLLRPGRGNSTVHLLHQRRWVMKALAPRQQGSADLAGDTTEGARLQGNVVDAQAATQTPRRHRAKDRQFGRGRGGDRRPRSSCRRCPTCKPQIGQAGAGAGPPDPRHCRTDDLSGVAATAALAMGVAAVFSMMLAMMFSMMLAMMFAVMPAGLSRG